MLDTVELLMVLQSSMLMWFIFSVKHDTLVTLTISRVISQLSQPSMEYLLVVSHYSKYTVQFEFYGCS